MQSTRMSGFSLGNALHVAAKHGDLALFQYLIEKNGHVGRS